MIADERFRKQPKAFWAHVRTISQAVGYTVKGKGVIRVPTKAEIHEAFAVLGLGTNHLFPAGKRPTPLGRDLLAYFAHRAERLNDYVEPRLMDAAQAKEVFEEMRTRLKPKVDLPMNKQKGAMSAPLFLTGIINMLVEQHCAGAACDFAPRTLTTITKGGVPVRTLARWVDGAFPSAVNPIAIWEIKEYYYTTTFGSRVADGVYESLLDGMELEELREHEKIDVLHYLMVDSHYTWWKCGRSYLCRILDMLHMGYVDEVLFGSEVVERLPALVESWIAINAARA